MVTACRESLQRLDRPVLDVAQLHWPPPLGWQEKGYLAGFAQLQRSGTAREIGLSNYGPKTLRAAHAELQKQGATLASNQVQFSLVSRVPLQSGLFDVCKELSITPIAYSPLGLGLLTDRYSIAKDNLPPGPRGFLFRSLLPELDPLLSVLREIGAKRNKSCGQIAINWTICKGAGESGLNLCTLCDMS